MPKQDERGSQYLYEGIHHDGGGKIDIGLQIDRSRVVLLLEWYGRKKKVHLQKVDYIGALANKA